MNKLAIKLFEGIYRKTRSSAIRRNVIKVISSLEGGQFFSPTSRALLKEYSGLDIGIGTYGPCFDPANATPGVSIGKYCSIAPGVSMYTRDHPYEHISTCPLFYNASAGIIDKDTIPYGSLEIGNDVWIGRNVTILPSCKKIGNGAVIGAGSVVSHDVPAYAIVTGVPARIRKYRFDEKTINCIEEIKWWDWNVEEILANTNIFSDINHFLEYAYQRKTSNED